MDNPRLKPPRTIWTGPVGTGHRSSPSVRDANVRVWNGALIGANVCQSNSSQTIRQSFGPLSRLIGVTGTDSAEALPWRRAACQPSSGRHSAAQNRRLCRIRSCSAARLAKLAVIKRPDHDAERLLDPRRNDARSPPTGIAAQIRGGHCLASGPANLADPSRSGQTGRPPGSLELEEFAMMTIAKSCLDGVWSRVAVVRLLARLREKATVPRMASAVWS
jgi:hypothetical protein